MKAIAKANIKYDNVWYTAGDSFEVEENDLTALEGLVDVEKEKPTRLADMEVRPNPKKDEKKKQEKAE